jgi:hypothetical protein
MGADDPREVAVAFLTAQGFVTNETQGRGGWVTRTGGGGLDALAESVVFLKERHLPNRDVYNVRFTNKQGMRLRWTVALTRGHDGVWQVMSGGGGSAEEPPANAPKNGDPWANLGGGGWPRQFYSGGAIEEDDGAVARVRLRSANGVELEDTVEEGEALFVSDEAIQTPLEVELYDGAGDLIARHTTFAFWRLLVASLCSAIR